jgi:outer membrane protein TolC
MMRINTQVMRCAFLIFLGAFHHSAHAARCAADELSLQKALDMAFRNNPRMIEARNNIISARGKRLRESTLADPGMEFEIGGLNRGEEGERDVGLKKFEVRQEFDPPGVLWLKSRIARNEISSREDALKEVWSGIYSEVRNAYYTVLLKEKELAVEEENLKSLRRFLDRVTSRFQAGEALRNDLQRAKLEVLGGENALLIARKELDTSRAAFNLLIGRAIGRKYTLVDSLEYRGLKGTLEEMIEAALKRNPGIAQSAIELDSSRKSLARERLSALPAPFVAFERSLEDYDNDYKILLGFTIPFWNWNVGAVKSAVAERETAESKLDALKRMVSYEAYNAYLEAQLADRQAAIGEKALAEANELLRLAELRYNEGKIGYLEYIDQIKAVTGSRLRYQQGIFNFNRKSPGWSRSHIPPCEARST